MIGGLTNSLTDMAEEIRILDAAAEEAQRTAAKKMIAAGKMLGVAKDECPHGQWAAFLERAGLHERKARRHMQLARSGLKSDTVSDLGGLKAALVYIAKREEFIRTMLPDLGKILLVGHHDPLSDEAKGLVGYVWAAANYRGYYYVAVDDLDTDCTDMFCRPIRAEPIIYRDIAWWPLWEYLGRLMRCSPADCCFKTVPYFETFASFCILEDALPKVEVGHG